MVTTRSKKKQQLSYMGIPMDAIAVAGCPAGKKEITYCRSITRKPKGTKVKLYNPRSKKAMKLAYLAAKELAGGRKKSGFKSFSDFAIKNYSPM